MRGSMEKDFSCQRLDGKTIRGKVYIPDGRKRRFPTVIFCHGFGGNYRELAHHGVGLAESGICCILFDFCGGGSESTSDGTMLEMSVKTERDDLLCVWERVKRFSFVDKKRLFLMGESQGGFVAAYAADGLQREVCGLILWYPAFQIPEAVRATCENGIPDDYEVFGLRIGQAYAVDAMDLKPYERMAYFKKPVLMIHGDRDGIVPFSYSERAVKAFPRARLEPIVGADHGFDGADCVRARELSRDFVLASEKKSLFSFLPWVK